MRSSDYSASEYIFPKWETGLFFIFQKNSVREQSLSLFFGLSGLPAKIQIGNIHLAGTFMNRIKA